MGVAFVEKGKTTYMTPEEKLKKAMDMVVAGDREEARPLLLELYQTEQRVSIKVQTILGLISVLNRRTDRKEMLRLCEEALGMVRGALRAKLLARKGTLMFDEVSELEHARGQIVFPPNLIGFATEADQQEYRELSNRIDALTKSSQELIKEAAEVAKESGDVAAQAEIISTMAENIGANYMHYQMRNFRGNEIVDTTYARLKRRVFMWLGMPMSWALTKRHQQKLRQLEEACMTFFDRSIGIYDQAGMELEKGYELFSAALQLRTFGKLRRAKGYLLKARPIAEKMGDKSLLARIDDLLYSIKVRGRDIPDYVNGETRESQKENN